MHDARDTKQMLDLAARLAWRGWGRVEPNPLVGCVLGRPGGGAAGERIIGMGHHRVYGGIHAEVDALHNARSRGIDARGAIAYVTLEPCSAPGKQPACTEALVSAGVGRVVCARPDPHPGKAGGAQRLIAAGIPVEFSGASHNAIRLTDPFIKRVTTGMPWVIVKWAQTIDGRIATRTGDSKWISNERSRRWVHLTRGRVDAVLTGIGTVKADDPQLSARDVPVRRVAQRIVIDPDGEVVEHGRRLLKSGPGEVLALVCEGGVGKQRLQGTAGARAVELPSKEGKIDLKAGLSWLAAQGAATVLCECGPGFASQLWGQRLVDELHIYVAPRLMGDEQAKPALRGFVFERADEVPRMELCLSKRIGEDVLLVYRRPWADGTP